MEDFIALFKFYSASTLILIFTLPISWVYFQKSQSHLLIYGRVLGVLLTGYLVWLLSAVGMVSFNLAGIMISLCLLAAAGIGLLLYRGNGVEELRSWWRCHGKTALLEEAVFLSVFALFAVFVSYHSRISGTEKHMDFMFLNGLMRGVEIPPHDPWFAGEAINYYYGGYFLVALLGRLSTLPPAFTFNLALAILFAWTFSLSWAMGSQLCGSRKIGILSPLLVVVMGNLDGFLQTLRLGWPFKINYFSSSRVIKDTVGGQVGETINEFPFFSYFHADLHPHVMSVPFVIVFIALLYEFLLNLRSPFGFGQGISTLGRWIILVISLGGLGFINGLDLPTFMILFSAVLFFGFMGVATGLRSVDPGRLKIIFLPVAMIFATAVGAYLFYYPFYGNYVAPKEAGGFIKFNEVRSTLGDFL